MEGTLLNTDVTAYVASAWSVSILLLGGLMAWAINEAVQSDNDGS